MNVSNLRIFSRYKNKHCLRQFNDILIKGTELFESKNTEIFLDHF